MYSKMSHLVTMINQSINDKEHQNLAKPPHTIKHPLRHHHYHHLFYTHQNMQYLNNDPNHYSQLYHLNPAQYTTTIRRSYAESQYLHPRLSKRCYPTLRRYYETRNEYNLPRPWTHTRHTSITSTTNQFPHCSWFPFTWPRMVHWPSPKHPKYRPKRIPKTKRIFTLRNDR